jgi:transposase
VFINTFFHLLLQLLLEDRFPRVWVPSAENRDLRQLLWHRHRLVQMRTRIMNQLQAVAMNEGVRRKKALWNKSGRAQLESLSLAPWAARQLTTGNHYWSRDFASVLLPVFSEPNLNPAP